MVAHHDPSLRHAHGLMPGRSRLAGVWRACVPGRSRLAGVWRACVPGRSRLAGAWCACARRAVAVAAAGLLAAACAGGPPVQRGPDRSDAPRPSRAPGALAAPSGQARPQALNRRPAGNSTPGSRSQAPGSQARPLAGVIVGIDPGHNGGNFADPGLIGRLIWNGAGWETCDTTGTQTDAGYTEAQFTFAVAGYLQAGLRRDGARVVMTRTSNDGVGPCVNKRAQIINHAGAQVAVDIHADGGPASGRGFTILEPVADGPNDGVIAASARFGADVRQAMLADTAMPESNYEGVDGIMPRDDLAGLNLTTVPKVLIECGNMRNATDARLLVTAAFQTSVASALLAAIVRFLGRPAGPAQPGQTGR